MDEKLGPLPLPKMPEERNREALARTIAEIDRAIESHKAVATIAQMPNWGPLKEMVDNLIGYYTRAMVRQGDPTEIYRLQGSIRALSDFSTSPEDALKAVERLRERRDALARSLPTRA